MQLQFFLVVLVTLTAAGYVLGWRRAFVVAEGPIANLHSTPGYHGSFVALWAGLPALLLFALYLMAGNAGFMTLALASLPPELVSDGQARDLVRADILNVFDNPLFTTLQSQFGTPTFGQLTAVGGFARSVQFQVRLGW